MDTLSAVIAFGGMGLVGIGGYALAELWPKPQKIESPKESIVRGGDGVKVNIATSQPSTMSVAQPNSATIGDLVTR